MIEAVIEAAPAHMRPSLALTMDTGLRPKMRGVVASFEATLNKRSTKVVEPVR